MENSEHTEDKGELSASSNLPIVHNGTVVGWKELSEDVREFFPPNNLIQLVDKLSDKKKFSLAGFDFSGIDQVTDDMVILLTELAASKTTPVLDNVTFLSFVGCVHLTDFAVKLVANAFIKLREIHLDGCPLLTETSLMYLKKCPDIVQITMAGTAVTLKPDMGSILVKLDGCPLIPTTAEQCKESDIVKLVISGKSCWTYDLLDFLTKVKESGKEEPLNRVDMNKISYATDVKIGDLQYSFNVFEVYASSSILSQFLSDQAVYVITLDMDTPAACNPQVVFMGRISNILAVSPNSHIILLALHSSKDAEEISARLCTFGAELKSYFDLQKKAVADDIEEWHHQRSKISERHFQVQQMFSKMKCVDEFECSFSLLQINSETSKVIQRWPEGNDNYEDDTKKIAELQVSIQQILDSGLADLLYLGGDTTESKLYPDTMDTDRFRFISLVDAHLNKTKSQKAMRSLSKSDISEVKSFSNPPKIIKKVAEATLILLGHEDKSWSNFKRSIADYRFTQTLMSYDYDSVSDNTLKQLECYFKDEEMKSEYINRISRFGGCLWSVVEFVYEYGRQIKPKMDLLKRLKSLNKVSDSSVQEYQGPGKIIQNIQTAIKTQRKRSTIMVAQSYDAALSEVESCIKLFKDYKIVTLDQVAEKVNDKTIKDLRVLDAVLKKLDAMGKCLHYSGKGTGKNYVITDITWYMEALNTLYIQKYKNVSLRNGARWMSLDPDVPIFTEEVIKNLIPCGGNLHMTNHFLDLLLMHCVLCPVPRRSVLSEQPAQAHWFLFCHMKSSFLRDKPDHAARAGRKFKEFHWPDRGHQSFSPTDIEVEVQYRLTRSFSLELLPHFLCECIQLGELVVATKSSWIARCGAVEIIFKHNIKQVNVSSSFEIQARMTKFEDELQPFTESCIHQYIWSVLSQYLAVLDALIADYPYMFSRIKHHKDVNVDENGSRDVHFLTSGYTNGYQSLLPFHDFHRAFHVATSPGSVQPCFNLPSDNREDKVIFVCTHCGMTEDAMLKLWSSESRRTPAFSGVAFERIKGEDSSVCGSLVSSEAYTSESEENQVVVVCKEPLYLTGMKDVHITVIKEGSIKLVIGERNYFTKDFHHDPDLKKCRVTFDLGTGMFSIIDKKNGDIIETQDLREYACKAGDKFKLHASKSRLIQMADKTKSLMIELELFRNGSRFISCHVPHHNVVGIILQPSKEHTPCIVLQAPEFPMVASHHFPINTLLLYRRMKSQNWDVGHVVSHSNGYILVSTGDSNDYTKLMPGSADILPVSAYAEGLAVTIKKELLKSRDQLRNYIRLYNVEPAPVSLFSNVSASGAKIYKHEPRLCVMNVNSPFVLDRKYQKADLVKHQKTVCTHIYLPRKMSVLSVLHPNRQLVHKWHEQDIHILCSGSSQFDDVHFMDVEPIEVTFEEVSEIQKAYLGLIIKCYQSLLTKQHDILPYLEKVFPMMEDLPKDEIVRGVRVLLQLYKTTLTVAQHLSEKKQFMGKAGKQKLVYKKAAQSETRLFKQRIGAFANGDPELFKCDNHCVQNLDDNLLEGRFVSFKYASCVNALSVELSSQPPEIAAICDALAHFPNLQVLTILNAPSLEGISRCRKLMSLFAPGGSFTRLPDDLIQLKDTLTVLDIFGAPVTELPNFITEFHKLTNLNLKNTLIKELPENIGNLKNLENLNIGHTLICSLPESFGFLQKLNHLSLNGVPWKILKPVGHISQEVTLDDILHKVLPGVTSDIALKMLLTPQKCEEFFNKADINDQKLLSSQQWDIFNELVFNFLPRFGLNSPEENDEHGGFPTVLFKCYNLRVLTMNYQGIRFVPEKIKMLPSLQVFTLSDCPYLENVSIELGKAPLKLLDVTGCPNLKTPPKEIVQKGKKTVIAYLRRLSQGSVKINRTKLMFVGLGGVGKTSLMRALGSKDHKAPHTEGEAITDGIDITTWNPTEGLTYSVWDFAGQTVYYNTHQFFMSKRAVYILVWNTRLGYQHSGLEFWMSSIACHSPDSPVFVVGTHSDQVTNHELPESSLANRFPNIKGFHVVSSYTGDGIKELSDELQQVTLGLPYMGSYIPEAWLNYEKAILMKRTEQSLLDWSKVEQLGNMCGIYGDEVKQAVIFLSDLGVLQYFSNRFLCDRIVINPQWIVDVMACVVSVHSSVIQNGRLKHSDIKVIWKNYPQQLHDWLLRLTEVFDLTFPVDNKDENIIPCLLPSDEPVIDWPDVEHTESVTETKMIYKFDYLPAGLFNRIQVRLYQFSDDSSIWRTGSLLVKNDHYCLVKQTSELNVLVKACGHCPENIVLLVHEVIEELIAEFFTGIKYEYQIPCNGCVKMGTTDPAMFSSAVLRRAIDMKTYFLQCHTFFHTLSLTELQSIIPPQSGGDFEIQMQNAVQELTDLENSVRADVFFLLCKQNVPSDDDNHTVHPQQIKDDLEKHSITCWYEKDLASKKPEDLDVAIRTAKQVLVFMSDEFVEDPLCQSLFLHVINRMQKDYILLMVGKERKWMTSSLGAHVTGKVFINFQRLHQYNEKIQSLIKVINEKLGRNTGTKYAPADVFLSYCWSNSESAVKVGHVQAKEGAIGYGDPRKIKSFLEKHQLSCWVDYERVGRVGLFHDIAEGMKEAKAVVAFISDEYVISDNCQMEFRFAHIALRKPIVLAVVGTGYKWDATEIGMLALGYPKINFQVNNKMAYQDLLNTVQELVAKAREKEAATQKSAKNGKGQEERSPKEKAFQEVYEMAQRKFLRQISSFCDNNEPFPRLFVVDFNYSSPSELEAEKDTVTEEKSADAAETEPTFVVDELRSGQFCMKLLCEHESQWHATEFTYPIEIAGQDLVQVWECVAPFMARILSLLKHSNINLHILGTQEGEKLIKLMEQKAGLEYQTMIKPVYRLLRKYMKMKDRKNERGGLKYCQLPSGKYLWLCDKHQKPSYISVIEDDIQLDDNTDVKSAEDMLLAAIRNLAKKQRRENTTTQSTGSSALTGNKSSKDLSTVINQETDQVLDSSTDVNLVQSSENNSGTGTPLGVEKSDDSSQTKDNIQPTASTSAGSRWGSSKGAARLTSEEKVKIIKRTAAHHMATMGYSGHKETSQTCVIL